MTTPTSLLLFVGTALFGVTLALFSVVRLTLLASVYPDRVGTVHGLVGAAGDTGNTVLPPVAGFVAATTAWRMGLGFLIPVLVCVVVAILLYVPRRVSAPSETSTVITFDEVRELVGELQRPSLVLGTLIMIAGQIIYQAFVGFSRRI